MKIEKIAIPVLVLAIGGGYILDHTIKTVEFAEHEYREILSQQPFTQELPQDQMYHWPNLELCRPCYAVDVKKYTPEPEWQSFRASLEGTDLKERWLALDNWLFTHQYSLASCVQVTNYVHALRRGGLIE